MKTIIKTSDAPEPIGPYNQAVLHGNTMYVSGQIPIDPATGQLIEGDIAVETDRVMQNLGNILFAAGLDYTNVVKCSIFVKNMGDFSKINEAYGAYFQTDPPARETVEVANLPLNVNVEISCIAVS